MTEGEFSLFYLGGQFSHAIRKTPAPNDFRVQEEHGGMITSIPPSESLRTSADRVMALLPAKPLYARVDLVADQEDVLRVMEVELIEPSLYLRMDPEAPTRFADAIVAWLRGE